MYYFDIYYIINVSCEEIRNICVKKINCWNIWIYSKIKSSIP